MCHREGLFNGLIKPQPPIFVNLYSDLMILGPLKWYTLAETLRLAVHNGLTIKPDRSGVVSGDIAWDECDCGLLAVTVSQIFPSSQFPNLLTDLEGNCDASVEVGEIVIQVVRCAPQPEGDRLAPSVASLDSSAQEILRDAFEILTAARETLCTLQESRDIYAFLLRPLTSQGGSGACVGNELRLFVGLLRG